MILAFVASVGATTLHIEAHSGLTAHQHERLRDLLAEVADVTLVDEDGQRTLSLGTLEAGLPPEGFVIQSTPERLEVVASDAAGARFGAFAALELLGFGFLHPLDPHIPDALDWPSEARRIEQSPRWPVRGWHLHTMHPIELTHVLNGWGPGGPEDEQGFSELLREWDRFCEWAVANRQNHVQWVLLEDDAWRGWSRSEERRERLALLVERAHAWGLRVGVDVPLVLEQQNAFRLLPERGGDEDGRIRDNIDWLMAAGFDFLASESGFSEFHHPDDRQMLHWMTVAAEHMASRHASELWMKVHVAPGVIAEHFTDPETDGPLDFDFLPHFGPPSLGVLPHTVQHYALDDPAPTYGGQDFSAIRRFMAMEAGRRTVVWHPETSYWVSFDVDVPLFLPVYGDRRLHDLRLLAADEDAGRLGRGDSAGAHIEGQMVFSSGWEWGAWVSEVVAARAAWDPYVELSHEQAMLALLEPVGRPFGEASRAVRHWLMRLAKTQHELLILRGGQAWLQGQETWDEVGMSLGSLPGLDPVTTQPLRGPRGDAETTALLAEMEARFSQAADDIDAIAVPEAAEPLRAELADGVRITALRAAHARAVYLSEDPTAPRRAAQALVARRSEGYRAAKHRIAGWGTNPTAYRFGYLWTVRHLFYWRRDELAPGAVCQYNVIDPIEVAFANDEVIRWGGHLQRVVRTLGLRRFEPCLSPPQDEPLHWFEP